MTDHTYLSLRETSLRLQYESESNVCIIGSYYWTHSVFVKHIVLHISGSWLTGVHFHSCADSS